jgi:hypothetical protein
MSGAPHTPKQNNRTEENSSRYEFGRDARVDEGEMTNSQSPPSTVGLVNNADINLDTGGGATASKMPLDCWNPRWWVPT